ncbi:uncharacterized protein LOC133344240 [Lethenteron reissneri]|uniref:uncharacterized protein LOC133344240 n=1 Tax=Lethenteron reissneri TaxID=7753 RepID=UPI002AB623E8|nr:uncharacterized protein LOC133344240 [Lethenteron reissneri]
MAVTKRKPPTQDNSSKIENVKVLSRSRETSRQGERRGGEGRETSSVAGGSTLRPLSCLLSVGKYALFLLFLPPFLNYASLQREAKMLKPAGEVLDIGLGQQLYMSCLGSGVPVVLFDAPAGMSSDIWIAMQKELSSMTKVCIYDRAGIGFSSRAIPNDTTGMEKVWKMFTTGRMVDDLHRLVLEAKLARPLVLVGAQLGALNARFYSHIYDSEVSDLVLIDPLTEELFQEDPWLQYWNGQLVPSLQMLHLSAAMGLNRLGLITGLMQQPLTGADVTDDVVSRQKFLLCSPPHMSAAVEEHFLVNESLAQVSDIMQFKPLPSRINVTVINGNYYDELLPGTVNKVFTQAQQQLVSSIAAAARHVVVDGADRHAAHRNPLALARPIAQLVHRRQASQKSL